MENGIFIYSQFVSLAWQAKEQKLNTNLIQKDILIEDLKKKVKEVEEELHSHNLALEIQKAISSAKVNIYILDMSLVYSSIVAHEMFFLWYDENYY